MARTTSRTRRAESTDALIRLIHNTPHKSVMESFDIGGFHDRFTLTAAQVHERAMQSYAEERGFVLSSKLERNVASREFGLLSRAVTLASRSR